MNGADVNAQTDSGTTPLMFLVIMFSRVQDNTQIITQILEAFNESNIDLNIQDFHGGTALSWAASRPNESNENVVSWLIQNNACVDLRSNRGKTVLHWAALEGNGKITQMLIDAGADVHAVSNYGVNALDSVVTRYWPKERYI